MQENAKTDGNILKKPESRTEQIIVVIGRKNAKSQATVNYIEKYIKRSV